MFELILIVVVLLVIFGGGKLREAGSDLGAAVKGVRKALRGKSATPPPAAAARTAEPAPAPGAAADPRRSAQPDALADAVFPEELGPEAPAARENRRA